MFLNRVCDLRESELFTVKSPKKVFHENKLKPSPSFLFNNVKCKNVRSTKRCFNISVKLVN